MEKGLFDVVAVEDGKVAAITVWKKVSIERAIAKVTKYTIEYPHMNVGIALSETTGIGTPVQLVQKTVTVPQFLVIDGNQVKQNPKTLTSIFYEKK